MLIALILFTFLITAGKVLMYQLPVMRCIPDQREIMIMGQHEEIAEPEFQRLIKAFQGPATVSF